MSSIRVGVGFAAVVLGVTACDALFTGPPVDADVLDAPLPNLTPDELATFVAGDEAFEAAFAPATGLGPLFNNVACAGCHSGDGRGRPENTLTRISRGLNLALDVGGPQIQDRAIPGVAPESVPPGVDRSVRLPPPVFGVGLIEAIPDADILSNQDEFDADGDGVSGRVNRVLPAPWVPPTEPGSGPGPTIGRFSRKAQVTSLFQQSVEAYSQDMGITSEFLPHENLNLQGGPTGEAADAVPEPEVTTATIQAVVEYIRMLAPPAPGPANPRGDELFTTIGCDVCHVRRFTTGPHRIAALSNQPVELYSDLLLHDMGDGLADNRPDGRANGREWKTPPLWGLRVARDFLDGDLFLLHDGRATTVAEAIELHGGEGAGARDRYLALSAEDREALLDFVRSR